MSEEVIDSKILAVFFKPYICLRYNRGDVKLLTGLSSNAWFHVQIQDTDYTKHRSIDTMTPNKLDVYFVADMVVVDIDFPCDRYGFLLWPISSCCGRYGL